MRVVVFTDSNTVVTAAVVRALLREATVVGFVTTRPGAFPSGVAIWRVLARGLVVAVTNAEVSFREALGARFDLPRTARRCGIPVLVPPSGTPNDPDLLRELTRLRPEVALSCSCTHRFGRRVRGVFAHAVNLHGGLLPDYRGVMATSFSIFAGEAESGVTIHRMTGKLDGGPILVQGAVPLDEHSTLAEVSRAKSALAASLVPRALERIAADDPGRPQVGAGSSFTANDWMALTRLAAPAEATSGEIRRRIRAFGIVYLTIEEAEWPVTRVQDARSGARLAFRCADGRWLRPDRFAGLPGWLYRQRSGPSVP